MNDIVNTPKEREGYSSLLSGFIENAPLAIRTLRSIMENDLAPMTVRLQAVRLMLEYAPRMQVTELAPDKKYLLVVKGVTQEELDAIADAFDSFGVRCLCLAVPDKTETAVIALPEQEGTP